MGHFRLLAWAGFSVIALGALCHNAPNLAPGMFDWAEPGNVAAALAQGRGFSDPFDGGTGATAWVSPLPVWIEALVFLVFGIKTAASAKAMLVLVVAGLAATNALLLRGLASFGAWFQAGTSAAFIAYCVLVPGGPLVVLSEAWLDMLISAVLLWSCLGTNRVAAACFVAAAFLAPLENAGLAVALGFCVLALAWKSGKEGRSLAVPALAAAAAALAVTGWSVRNAAALGRVVPLKSNSWFELNLANVDSASGLPRMETVLRRLPYFDVGEFQRYATLGEMRYVDSFRKPALDALRADPIHFAGNVLRRLGAAIVFCRREGGGAATDFAFRPDDARRLEAAGELIALGATHALWTRIDAEPAAERSRLDRLGLADEPAALRDWAAKRIEYDERFRGVGGIGLGLMTAGFPVAALLLAALLGGGRLNPPLAWAALIACGMLLPYVLVNHNDRHQASVAAMQAVACGALAQALASRVSRSLPT